MTSLKGEAAIMQGPAYLPYIDFAPTLDAWRAAFSYDNDHLMARLANSILVASVSTLLCLLTGAMAVYGLTRFPSRLLWSRFLGGGLAMMSLTAAFYAPAFEWRMGLAVAGALGALLVTRLPARGPVISNEHLRFMIVSTRIVPPIVVILPLYVMAQRIGALDTHFALIAAYSAANLPVAIWLMMPAFGARATEQEESARLEGASRITIALTIFLPMVAASIAAIGLVIFVLCWNEYLFAAALTNDTVATLPGWVAGQMSIKEAQVGGEGDEWPQLSAAILFMAVPVLAFAAMMQRVLKHTATW